MRIALVHRKLTRSGGVEKNVVLLASGLAGRGHEVHVFCNQADVSLSGVTVRHVPALRLGLAAKYLSFARNAAAMLAQERFDVVQGFDLTTRQDVLRIGRGLVKVYRPALDETRGIADRIWRAISPEARAIAGLERRMLAPGSWTRIVAISRIVKKELVDAYAIPEEAIEVIYNGVDLAAFDPAKAKAGREAVRASLGIGPKDRMVLFVGTGFRRKGLDVLIQAVAPLDAKLVVVGRDGRARAYRSLAVRSKCGPRVIFAGQRAADAALYGAADVVALPTRYEPFGNVVLEALACGVPVVVSARAGASEILEEELSDLVIDPADAQALSKVLGHTLDHAAALGSTCRRIAERYSEESCVARYEALYRRIVERRDKPLPTSFGGAA